MDLLDLIIGLGAAGASFVLVVLLLVQGSAMLGSFLVEEDGQDAQTLLPG